jgi:DNA modification methylase
VNNLYLGDCLNVLRNKKDIADESVDLVYIDPPFNSKRDYAIFFDDEKIRTQHVAFEDTWSLKNIQQSLIELDTLQTEPLLSLLRGYQKVSAHAFPYLVMMGLRVNELHKVLKPNGSFYLHCDPTMSHYLKTICDVIFGKDNFINEIVWRRAGSHNATRSYGPIHDVILVYAKSKSYTFNICRRPYMKGHVESRFTKQPDGNMKFTSGGNVLSGAGTTEGPSGMEWRGFNPSKKKRHWAIPSFYEELMPDEYMNFNTIEKLEALYQAKLIEISPTAEWPIMVRYLDERTGVPYQDIWAYQPYTEGTVWNTDDGIDRDVMWLSPRDAERLHYPTQKPRGLLERIISVSTNKGDVVLDAFCGCGTTVDAAEHLGRNWIGIDISPVAIALIRKRMVDTYKGTLTKFDVRGIPADEPSAIVLWEQNPFAFQDWWVTEFGVLSPTYGKKGSDKGLDGIGKYVVGPKGQTCKVGWQVKGGKQVQSKDIDAFLGALKKAECELGVFLSTEDATKPMLETMSREGAVELFGTKYPKIQFLTLKEFFQHKRPKLPVNNITFSTAKFSRIEGSQGTIEL